MTTFTFRPAARENTPLIIGLAGPTKSGKTYSAHRLAQGLANGGVVAMLNAEGPRGHQYADKFSYMACDIEPPFSPERYIEALNAAKELNPACLIVDNVSHMHDGPGGLLEYHDAELDRMAGKDDWKKRDRFNFAAWIKPKAAENQFIYAMLGLKCPTILCFRAKEKLKIVPGKTPIDLGWQPIASDRVSFETIFTLLLPPHCKGVPDMALSEMREPFDTMVPPDRPIDEELGRSLAAWAAGGTGTVEERLRAAKTQDELVVAWGTLTREQRARYAKVKDEVKAQLSRPADEQTPLDPMANALGFIKAGDFDMARSMKQYVSDTDRQFIEDEIAARQGVTK